MLSWGLLAPAGHLSGAAPEEEWDAPELAVLQALSAQQFLPPAAESTVATVHCQAMY